jgi:hypothetical protein
LIVSNPPSHP